MSEWCVLPKDCYLCQGEQARATFRDTITDYLHCEPLGKKGRKEFMATFRGSLDFMADWLGQEIEEEKRRTGEGLLCEEHYAKVQVEVE